LIGNMRRTGHGRSLGPLLAALACACATAKPPPAAPPPAPARAAPPPLRLAVLPLEPRAAPEIAAAVNPRLARVAVEGVTETFQAPVSMEMAQLAIECIDHKPACYAAVARSVKAERLVWVELERGRGGAVKLRVCLFDAGKGAVVKEGTRAFPSAKAARAGGVALVDEVLGARPTVAGGPR
jgi:hypothetical protein